MEIYVVKVKNKLFKPKELYPYRLAFNENGCVMEEYFRTENELYTRLMNGELYKKQYFPKDLLSIQQFIDKGFSIYL